MSSWNSCWTFDTNFIARVYFTDRSSMPHPPLLVKSRQANGPSRQALCICDAWSPVESLSLASQSNTAEKKLITVSTSIRVQLDDPLGAHFECPWT